MKNASIPLISANVARAAGFGHAVAGTRQHNIEDSVSVLKGGEAAYTSGIKAETANTDSDKLTQILQREHDLRSSVNSRTAKSATAVDATTDTTNTSPRTEHLTSKNTFNVEVTDTLTRSLNHPQTSAQEKSKETFITVTDGKQTITITTHQPVQKGDILTLQAFVDESGNPRLSLLKNHGNHANSARQYLQALEMSTSINSTILTNAFNSARSGTNDNIIQQWAFNAFETLQNGMQSQTGNQQLAVINTVHSMIKSYLHIYRENQNQAVTQIGSVEHLTRHLPRLLTRALSNIFNVIDITGSNNPLMHLLGLIKTDTLSIANNQYLAAHGQNTRSLANIMTNLTQDMDRLLAWKDTITWQNASASGNPTSGNITPSNTTSGHSVLSNTASIDLKTQIKNQIQNSPIFYEHKWTRNFKESSHASMSGNPLADQQKYSNETATSDRSVVNKVIDGRTENLQEYSRQMRELADARNHNLTDKLSVKNLVNTIQSDQQNSIINANTDKKNSAASIFQAIWEQPRKSANNYFNSASLNSEGSQIEKITQNIAKLSGNIIFNKTDNPLSRVRHEIHNNLKDILQSLSFNISRFEKTYKYPAADQALTDIHRVLQPLVDPNVIQKLSLLANPGTVFIIKNSQYSTVLTTGDTTEFKTSDALKGVGIYHPSYTRFFDSIGHNYQQTILPALSFLSSLQRSISQVLAVIEWDQYQSAFNLSSNVNSKFVIPSNQGTTTTLPSSSLLENNCVFIPLFVGNEKELQGIQLEMEQHTEVESQTQSNWNLRLRFDLQKLGIFDVVAIYNGEDVSLEVWSESTAIKDHFRSHLDHLRGKLREASIGLSNFSFRYGVLPGKHFQSTPSVNTRG